MRRPLGAILGDLRDAVRCSITPPDLRSPEHGQRARRSPLVGPWAATAAASLLLLDGSAVLQPASAPPPRPAAQRTKYPASVFGIPVQWLSWRQHLPFGLGSVPWSTVAPKEFRVTPTKAIALALAAGGRVLLTGVQRIYVQATGLVGGDTGNPSAVYVIVFIGQSLGLTPGAGPNPSRPPVAQGMVVDVDGRTGKVELYMTGVTHGSAGRALTVPPGFWSLPAVSAYGGRLDIFPRAPSTTACSIPHGGSPNFPSLPGGCTTQVLTGRQYVTRLSPKTPPDDIWRVVLLSEEWAGPPAKPTAPAYGNNLAGWAFFLNRQCKVLRVQAFGEPPQYWR